MTQQDFEIEPTKVLKELEKNILVTKHLFDNVLALGKILKMKDKGATPLTKNYQFFEMRDHFIKNLTQQVFHLVKDGLKHFRETARTYFEDEMSPIKSGRDISNLVQGELGASPLGKGFKGKKPVNQYLRDVDNLHNILDDKIN